VQDDAAISAAEDEGDDELLVRLRKWWQKDRERSAEWRQKAKEDYAFVSGEQWTEEERQYLREQMRPEIVFNRIAAVVNSVSGAEITNRQEVKYLQREIGDAAASDIATEAARWFRDECDAEDEESDAFLDTVICGMGWTETRLDYESGNPDGDPVIERIDPLEM